MTRLIDADKLHTLFDKNCVGECYVCDFYKSVYYTIHNKDCKGHSYCGLIDEAPTVEERPKGEWIEDINIIACSHCHTIWLYRKTDFCPNCGADMREADNEQ